MTLHLPNPAAFMRPRQRPEHENGLRGYALSRSRSHGRSPSESLVQMAGVRQRDRITHLTLFSLFEDRRTAGRSIKNQGIRASEVRFQDEAEQGGAHSTIGGSAVERMSAQTWPAPLGGPNVGTVRA